MRKTATESCRKSGGRRNTTRSRAAVVSAALIGGGLLSAGPAMAAQNAPATPGHTSSRASTVSGVAPLPAPSFKDSGGRIVCSVALQSIGVGFFNPQVVTDASGKEHAEAAVQISTREVGCGDHVRIALQTKVCGAFGCNYKDVASASYFKLPMNGTEIFPILSAPLRNGTNRYRIEVDGTRYVLDGDDGPGPGFVGFVPETGSVYSTGVQLTS